jgi:predicted AlkP superfamily pyrophosphatase or phosphodiesterase
MEGYQKNPKSFMKKFFIVFLFALSALLASAQKKKVVFMIVDGIPADMIEKLNTPALDAISKIGGYRRAHVGGDKGAYSETPTISAVGYNSLLTGTWVNKHNVWDNDIKAPNYSYFNLFRLLETQSPAKKTAIFSTWLDNRTKLVGEGKAEAGGIQLDHHVDGLEKDTVKYPHDQDAFYIHRIDEEVIKQAAAYIREEGPDLAWIYLEYTDDMGQMYGNSGRFEKAIEIMDDQVRRVWEAIQSRERNFGDKYEIYITTDHGRDNETGKNHGGQSDRERTTWIVTNATGLNTYFDKHPIAIVDIMPSIANTLRLKLSRDQKMEIDGIALNEPVSAIEPAAVLEEGKITVKWKALEQKGNVKIWLSTTNNFKTGGKDTYKPVSSASLASQTAVIDVSKTPSEFYKIVIEAPNNMLNRWIVK